jgi:hypothetical protein
MNAWASALARRTASSGDDALTAICSTLLVTPVAV